MFIGALPVVSLCPLSRMTWVLWSFERFLAYLFSFLHWSVLELCKCFLKKCLHLWLHSFLLFSLSRVLAENSASSAEALCPAKPILVYSTNSPKSVKYHHGKIGFRSSVYCGSGIFAGVTSRERSLFPEIVYNSSLVSIPACLLPTPHSFKIQQMCHVLRLL